MSEYLFVKNSQVNFYTDVPLYYKTDDGEFVLYKPDGKKLDELRIKESRHPQLYLHKDDKRAAIKELRAGLHQHLAQNIARESISNVKNILNEVITEAMENPSEETLEGLPETIDIIFNGYSKNSELLKTLAAISSRNYTTAEHSINVMSYTMRYCFFCGFSVADTKWISLSALLHDIGMVEIPKQILESNQKLSDKQFQEYKSHTFKGHDIIKNNHNLDDTLSIAALEHHERLDGSGYPRGIVNISFEGQLVGLIDCFEYLTTREKSYRKVQHPFKTLQLIKSEVLEEGKFNKEIFVNLCNSLV